MDSPLIGRALGCNTPSAFWRLLGLDAGAEEWETAGRATWGCLAGLPVAQNAASLSETTTAILTEAQFGRDHWRLSGTRRAYYALRSLLPGAARPLLQRLAAGRSRQQSLLGWPIEDRYVRFQFGVMRCLLQGYGLDSIPYVHLWPEGKRFALLLTHDVETEQGLRFVPRVAEVDERYGFRSSFNLVPERYSLDLGLLAELRERGFEVGVHGLRHDGKLFSSPRVFLERVRRINGYLRAWQAAGFRSPFTHRNPLWMQALDAEYDSSFFDTDPFEPMPGGTMSIWPFFMGRFVELPYTLAQDHTLMRTLRETSPGLWLQKVAFIRRHCGMALVNAHPDYLLHPRYLAIYEAFLAAMRREADCWPALPREVARWWKQRASAAAEWDGRRWRMPSLPGATIGRIRLAAAAQDSEGMAVTLEPDGE